MSNTETMAVITTNSSSFKNTQQRNGAAKELLLKLFSERPTILPSLEAEENELLSTLVGPLADEPPGASQAAEGALTILSLSLVEGRLLDLTKRLPGDRGLGDWLCRELLQPMNVPSTQGPFQSSSFRGGYTSDQVRQTGLRQFVAWYRQDGRTLPQLQLLANHLVAGFAEQSVELPSLPEIAAGRLTFLKFLLLRECLLAEGSGGALEQYLLAGLLEQELATTGIAHRIHTKNVGANDAATRAGGDIEVRHGQTLLKAYEVTANGWDTKLAQLDSSAKAGLTEVTIIANGVSDTSAAELDEALRVKAEQLGIDVAILDLRSVLDVLASRVTPHARAQAVVYVYRSLARWHRREPILVGRLIEILYELDLVVGDRQKDPFVSNPDVTHSKVDVSVLLSELRAMNAPDIPAVLRKLAHDLEVDSGQI